MSRKTVSVAPEHRLIEDEDENYQPPVTAPSGNKDLSLKASRARLTASSYNWNMHMDMQKLRAFKNWTVNN